MIRLTIEIVGSDDNSAEKMLHALVEMMKYDYPLKQVYTKSTTEGNGVCKVERCEGDKP